MRFASKADVVAALRRAGSTVIPDAYYLGTAKKESDFDLENISDLTASEPAYGLYQVRKSEAVEAGENSNNLFDIDTNTRAFRYLAERNRNKIRQTAGIPDGVPDPWDMGAYLGIAHNQGLAAAAKTIQQWGIDWPAYKERNPTLAIVAHGYGDYVLYDVQTYVAGDGTTVQVSGRVALSRGELLIVTGLGVAAVAGFTLAMR